MSTVIPPAFAFRFSIPVRHAESLPLKGKPLLSLTDEFQLLWPDATLMGRPLLAGPPQSGVELKIGWNANGLGIAYSVRGKTNAPQVAPQGFMQSDGLQVWIDTRNTQTIHRASRFCHHFCLLPTGGGDNGQQPFVRQLPIARASEDAKQHEPADFRIEKTLRPGGYDVEAWLPAATLTGFDIEACSQLGFSCLLVDRELGDASFTVGSDFPVANDPSLWQTLDLVR